MRKMKNINMLHLSNIILYYDFKIKKKNKNIYYNIILYKQTLKNYEFI